eukprot:11206069-Lingulodinium_polyedra.AAC.1
MHSREGRRKAGVCSVEEVAVNGARQRAPACRESQGPGAPGVQRHPWQGSQRAGQFYAGRLRGTWLACHAAVDLPPG